MRRLDIYITAVENAKSELRQAEQNLKVVDTELESWAIAEVMAKREKINALVRAAKKEMAV